MRTFADRNGGRSCVKRLLTSLLAAALPALSQANICDRTLQVRDAIMRHLEADNCAAVDSEGLASIIELDLQNKQITTLRAGDFAGLTRLHVLRLGYNELTALPAGVFDDLAGLQFLYLGYNELVALPDGLFDGLTSLQRLDLHNNRLVGLAYNDPLFAGLPTGVQLYLGEQTEEPTTLSGDLAGKVAALETRMAALEASIAALQETLEAAMAAQRTTLEASIATLQETLEASDATLQETLEQRMEELEAASDDAPSSRLLIVPLNQSEGAQEPSE